MSDDGARASGARETRDADTKNTAHLVNRCGLCQEQSRRINWRIS